MVCRAVRTTWLAIVFVAACALDTMAEDQRVAGVQPDQRPPGAPIIERMIKGDAWYARALTGIERPYPYSLRFLEDQGNWYTPFSRRGISGPYDVRGWHQQEKQQTGD